jgi:hypothetical protein
MVMIKTPRKYTGHTGLLEGVSLLDGDSNFNSRYVEKQGLGRLHLFSATDFQENQFASINRGNNGDESRERYWVPES